MFAFAGQIFQFVARPGNVDNYGFNFLRHPLSLFKEKIIKMTLWSSGRSAFGQSCFWLKYIRPKVGIGLKYYCGRSIPRAKMCLGPKYAWGQSGLGAKLGVSRSEVRSKNGGRLRNLGNGHQ